MAVGTVSDPSVTVFAFKQKATYPSTRLYFPSESNSAIVLRRIPPVAVRPAEPLACSFFTCSGDAIHNFIPTALCACRFSPDINHDVVVCAAVMVRSIGCTWPLLCDVMIQSFAHEPRQSPMIHSSRYIRRFSCLIDHFDLS
jgi:hypothetical protein